MGKINFSRLNPLYQQDLYNIANSVSISLLHGKSIAVTGCSGLLGTLLVDSLMWLNEHENANITVYALGRNTSKIEEQFSCFLESPLFKITEYNLNCRFPAIEANYIFHCAGNSHPALFNSDPVGTLMGNIIGTYNVLDFAKTHDTKVLILSSGEVYGENRNLGGGMAENFLGQISLESFRSCYPEGKRAVEALCQSFRYQHGVDIKIARPCRIFGPTMSNEDNKASAQFLKKAKKGEPLILKSIGNQQFSYIYGADAVSALFKIILDGETGEAYNISNKECDIRLKDFAKIIAEKAQVEILFDCTGEAGGSLVTNAILDNSKLRELGWNPLVNIDEAITRTLEIMEKI